MFPCDKAAMDARDLLLDLRSRFAPRADPTRAAAQQAYMKSSLPYHGLPMAAVVAACRESYAGYPFDTPAAWRADVYGVFRGATHREEWYAALALAGHKSARELQGLPKTAKAKPLPDAPARASAALEVYARIISEAAWWDIVDDVAVHRVGPLLFTHRALVTPVLRSWIASDDIWLRRAAIIAQIGLKADTDTELLTHAIDAAMDDKVFWLRKAIGWSLREYAKVDAPWVLDFVAAREGRMSGLSQREALKHLGAIERS